MLEKISQADMEEGPEQDLATTVLTCEGDLRDPAFPGRLQSLVLRLRELISDEEKPFWVKKVEPWNSVRVTFTIPREAAQRLRQLAERGDRALRDLGILSVQLEGDQIISLTLAGCYGEPPKEIILQKAAGDADRGSPASAPSTSSSPARTSGASSSPFTVGSGASTSGFRSPNVVAPPNVVGPREPLPFLSGGPFVRPGSRAPFPFASMTHSMKQNNSSSSSNATPSRFPFTPSPPLAAAFSAARGAAPGSSRGNVALSSPLLVNLLQSETGVAPKLMMPPPLDTGQQPKRKRRPTRSSRGSRGDGPISPSGSPSPPSPEPLGALSSQDFALSHIPLSPPLPALSARGNRTPTEAVPAAEGRPTKHLINPFTGHLEPMPSDEEEEEPAARDPETSESSENGGHSERSLSDGGGGKDSANPSSSDTDSGIGKSSSSQSSTDPEPLREEEATMATAVSLSSEGEKLKLRLKLDSKRSSVQARPVGEVASPPSCPPNEPPRVPPLHISLRGPNAAVVVSPRKAEVSGAAKKRPARTPRSSTEDPRRGCRGARGRDKASERLRELSLLSGGGIVRLPVSMSPTVVLTPLQLQQHPSLGPSRGVPCTQSTKVSGPTHWSPAPVACSSEADSSVRDGPSPGLSHDRMDLPQALRSCGGPGSGAAASTSPSQTSPERRDSANSALGVPDGHTAPHRTLRGQVTLANGHPEREEDAPPHPRPCRSPATRPSAMGVLDGALCAGSAGTNHVRSDDEVVEQRQASPAAMARLISLDTAVVKKAFVSTFQESDLPVLSGKLGGLVGGNHHRMPTLIPTGGTGGNALRGGDVVLCRDYALRHHCSPANSVLKPGVVRMNRLRFGQNFSVSGRADPVLEVVAKTNGVLSPPPGECDSTMDAESSLDSDDLPNGPSPTTTGITVSSRAVSASAIVSEGGYLGLSSCTARGRGSANGSTDFRAANGDGVTTTLRDDSNASGVSPDSCSGTRDLLGSCDGEKSGDEEASLAHSEDRGRSSCSPSESPSSNTVTPDSLTAPLREASESPVSLAPTTSSPPPSCVASSQAVREPVVLPSDAPSLPASAAVASPSSSWNCVMAPTDTGLVVAKAQSLVLQPQDGGVLPACTTQAPVSRVISPTKWAASDSQRVTLIFKSNLAGNSSSPTSCQRSLLSLPTSASAAQAVPIKVLALPSSSSTGLSLKSSLVELISPTVTMATTVTTAPSSCPPSPPVRLVVSKMSPGTTANTHASPSSTSVNTSAVTVKSAVATGSTSSVAADPEQSTATLAPVSSAPPFTLDEASWEPRVLQTDEVDPCPAAESCRTFSSTTPDRAPVAMMDAETAAVVTNHTSSSAAPDSFTADILGVAERDGTETSVLERTRHASEPGSCVKLDNHNALEWDGEVMEDAVDSCCQGLEPAQNLPGSSLPPCEALAQGEEEAQDPARLRNQRRRIGHASPSVCEEQADAVTTSVTPSDHSSEEEMSLSELAHKSRGRVPRQGKEDEREEVEAVVPVVVRKEEGGRPRRTAAEPKGSRRPPPVPGGPATHNPLAPSEEALRRATDRSKRSPAAMRDHRSPPRVTNQRGYRRDQESCKEDEAVVAIKRKTRASGPTTDPQLEAAAPNKRRRYSKDSHR